MSLRPTGAKRRWETRRVSRLLLALSRSRQRVESLKGQLDYVVDQREDLRFEVYVYILIQIWYIIKYCSGDVCLHICTQYFWCHIFTTINTHVSIYSGLLRAEKGWLQKLKKREQIRKEFWKRKYKRFRAKSKLLWPRFVLPPNQTRSRSTEAREIRKMRKRYVRPSGYTSQ